jgi:hypothetical protein
MPTAPLLVTAAPSAHTALPLQTSRPPMPTI